MTDPSFSAATSSGSGPVSKTKWIVQIVVSVLCLGNIVTLILAILGLVKADTDLPTANKYYKWGWIAYAIFLVLWIVGLILYFVFVGTMIANVPETTY